MNRTMILFYDTIAKGLSNNIMARRALLTDTERKVLETDEQSERFYQVVSRVRKKINEELPQDVQIIKQNHSELHNELLGVVNSDSRWIRNELESKRADIESEFPDGVVPKLTRFNNIGVGLWIRIHTGADHMALLETVENVGEYLHSLGYNVRAAYDTRSDPDVGEPHYQGHLYALPVEIGIPEYPVGEMPVGSEHIKKFQWRANRNVTGESDDT